MTETLAGLFAPLVAVAASWLAVEHTHRTNPARLTAVMLIGFAAKAIFFGAYVAAAIAVFRLRPAPFAASFTASFIALYGAEALWLRRLFAK